MNIYIYIYMYIYIYVHICICICIYYTYIYIYNMYIPDCPSHRFRAKGHYRGTSRMRNTRPPRIKGPWA